MAIHANLTEENNIIYKNTSLSGVLLNQTFWVPVIASHYSGGALADVYNGYPTAPLNRGSQFSLLDSATLIDYEVESELSAADEDGHIQVEFPRLFASALSGDSGTDNILNIADTSGTNFQVNDWVGITDSTGDIEVNKITGISSGQLTFLNNFSKDWTTANSALVGYGVAHHFGGDTGSNQSNKEGTWEANYEASYRLNQDKVEGAFDDSTANNNDGINNGTTDIAAQIDRGRHLDGIDDDIDLGASSAFGYGDTTFTIEFSIETTDINSSAIIAKGVNNAGGGWGIYMSSASTPVGSITFIWANPTDGVSRIYTTSATVNNGVKRHIIVEMTTDTVTAVNNDAVIYIDGVDITALTKNKVGEMKLNTVHNTKIGSRIDSNSYFVEADMDEVTISNIGRSADWKKARYQSWLGTWLSFEGQVAVGPAKTLMMMGI